MNFEKKHTQYSPHAFSIHYIDKCAALLNTGHATL